SLLGILLILIGRRALRRPEPEQPAEEYRQNFAGQTHQPLEVVLGRMVFDRTAQPALARILETDDIEALGLLDAGLVLHLRNNHAVAAFRAGAARLVEKPNHRAKDRNNRRGPK